MIKIKFIKFFLLNLKGIRCLTEINNKNKIKTKKEIYENQLSNKKSISLLNSKCKIKFYKNTLI